MAVAAAVGEQHVRARDLDPHVTAAQLSGSRQGREPGDLLIAREAELLGLEGVRSAGSVGDVKGRRCVIVDDIIDTAGTLTRAAKAIKEAGATAVSACVSHPGFSGQAIQRIEESPLSEVIVSDTIPLREDATKCKKVKVQTVSRMLGEAVKRIHQGDSISSLFI